MSVTSEPSDNTTLSAVLADYGDAGYAGQLRVDDDGVHCSVCSSVSPADRIEVRSLRRLEGASDPADMVAVIATACPVCATMGTMVVMFGPEASEAEATLLRRAQDHRFDDDQPPPSADRGEAAG